MEKKITSIVLVTIFLFFYCGLCNKERKYSIHIDNNSNHQILYYFDGLQGNHNYPDTVLPISKPSMVNVEAGKRFYQDGSISWEQFYEQLPSDTLSLYFFHPDTLNTYNWSTIRSQYKVLKRYDLSIQDLQLRNFTISYP